MAHTGNIRVRFAPSPTGHLHIGGARSAIFNWLFARNLGGTYLLRIEDTDVLRSTQEYLHSQLRSFQWLNVMPDEPMVFQMSRVHEHQKAAAQLVEKGMAYPCFCVPRAADDVVDSLEQGLGSKYSGTCRNKKFTQEDLTQPHAIRFKIPEGLEAVEFKDLILGSVRVQADHLDDFVIIRRDGTPIFNFCNVVDDIFMNITHIIRGQDHVSNTSKQVLLYRALGAQEPHFAHIPLILGQDGSKLSKRDAAVSVDEYRQQGYLPDALFNYLVRLGWSHGDQEVFDKEELVKAFSLDHVGKKGSIFDMKKLQWLNGLYLRKTPAPQLLKYLEEINPDFVQNLQTAWPDQTTLHKLIDEYKQRAVTLVDVYREVLAFSYDPTVFDTNLIAKWHTPNTKPMLEAFASAMVQASPFNHETLVATANQVCTQFNEKLVSMAQPLRLALTGSIVSPGVFELIALIGQERASKRLRALIDILK